MFYVTQISERKLWTRPAKDPFQPSPKDGKDKPDINQRWVGRSKFSQKRTWASGGSRGNTKLLSIFNKYFEHYSCNWTFCVIHIELIAHFSGTWNRYG